MFPFIVSHSDDVYVLLEPNLHRKATARHPDLYALSLPGLSPSTYPYRQCVYQASGRSCMRFVPTIRPISLLKCGYFRLWTRIGGGRPVAWVRRELVVICALGTVGL